MAELRAGLFCSECRQSKSEIERTGKSFERHLKDVDGHPIPASDLVLKEKSKEFDDQIADLQNVLRQLANERSSVIQAIQREQIEAQNRRNEEQRLKSALQNEAIRQRNKSFSDSIAQSTADAVRSIGEQFEAARQRNAERRQQDDDRLASLREMQEERREQRAAERAAEDENRLILLQLSQEQAKLEAEQAEQRQKEDALQKESSRLQELANAGLASGPTSSDVGSPLVYADKVASVWNRAMSAKESVEGVGNAFERLVSGGYKGPSVSTELVVENAFDSAALQGRVMAQLSPAADALLSGNYQQAEKIEAKLDAARSQFFSGADSRVRRVIPVYNAIRSPAEAKESIENLRAPIVAPIDNLDRAQKYIKASGGMFDALVSPPTTSESKPERQEISIPSSKAVRWGPATASGPLRDQVAKTFRSSSYTERVISEPVVLYRAYGGKAGKFGPYWTAKPPSGPVQSTLDSALAPSWGNDASKVVKIRIPAGTTLFEGVAAQQGGLVGGGHQVFLEQVDPAWEIGQ